MKNISGRIAIISLLLLTLNSQNSERILNTDKIEKDLQQQRLMFLSEIKQAYLEAIQKSRQLREKTVDPKISPIVILPRDTFKQCIAISHNRNVPLLQLSDYVLINIFSSFINPSMPIESNILNSLKLSATCMRFSNMLPKLGNLIKKHSYDDKYWGMHKLQSHINSYYPDNYERNRRALILLIHAQAPRNTDPSFSLLPVAVEHDDTEMASLLFQYGANANEKNAFPTQPVFFHVKSSVMAQLFAENNVNWQIRLRGRSILHVKSDILCPTKQDMELLEKLLRLFPRLINTLSYSRLTPLDYAQLNLEDIKEDEKKKQKETFIALLRRYGAKTADELNRRVIARISLLKSTNLR